ncbi:hypothetical protein PHLCEN_2v4004 [Hermanssonia centrifuga]|uniref:Uncharacterized protein n=1 Tax=Hermanssonia centrifuga TaxID=98765 RepID=A0A2R6Q7F3_9APHY|nr:hypothetical protein PHLCEN_2v4004 [Hermanssonia centrifuga]
MLATISGIYDNWFSVISNTSSRRMSKGCCILDASPALEDLFFRNVSFGDNQWALGNKTRWTVAQVCPA